MAKIKVLLHSIWYPLAIASYFRKALKRNPNIDLRVMGIYTGSWIPWGGTGMNLPEKYAIPPDVVVTMKPGLNIKVDYEFMKPRIHPHDWKPDLVLTIEGGANWTHKPSDGIVATVATDAHCISGDTLLATGHGILYAYEAGTYTTRVCDKHGMSMCQGVVYKGNIITRKITLENGMILNCTDDHLIENPSGEFIEARELKVGDELVVSRGSYAVEEGTDKDYSVGFVLGSFQGDGSFAGQDIVNWTISKKEKKTFEKSIREHLLDGFDIDVVTNAKHYSSKNAKRLQVRRWGFYRFLKSIDIKGGKVPLFIRRGSKKLIGGYIAGLFAADGCSVDGIIRFTSKDEQLVRELQIILNCFGILTRIKSFKTSLNSFKPGQTHWNLYVAAGNSHKYLQDLTGNIPGRIIRTDSRKRSTDSGYMQHIKIIDIEGAVRNNPGSRVGEPVYDVINSKSNTFLANGISVHNCIDYSHARSVSDYFFNLHPCYSMPDDKLLNYAYDPDTHYAMSDVEKDTDAVLVGMPYTQRIEWVKRLRASGVSVIFENGPVFDEYRQMSNRATIGLNWSSLSDTNARFFETMAMNLCLVTNITPDIARYGFRDGEHFLGFNTMEQAVEKVLWVKNHPDERKMIALAGYQKVTNENWTYDKLIIDILKETGLM